MEALGMMIELPGADLENYEVDVDWYLDRSDECTVQLTRCYCMISTHFQGLTSTHHEFK